MDAIRQPTLPEVIGNWEKIWRAGIHDDPAGGTGLQLALAIARRIRAVRGNALVRGGRLAAEFWMRELLIEGFEVINEAIFAEPFEREFGAGLSQPRSERRALPRQILCIVRGQFDEMFLRHEVLPEKTAAAHQVFQFKADANQPDAQFPALGSKMNSFVLSGAGDQQNRADIASLNQLIQIFQAATHRNGANAHIFFGVVRVEEADDSQRIALGNEPQRGLTTRPNL